MVAEIGLVSEALAFITAIYAAAAGLLGARRHSERLVASARHAALLTFPLLLLSAAALLAALLTEQYQIQYVWQVTDPSTPIFYRITALWGSQQGSLLFWNVLMAAFAFVALLIHWREHRPLMPYVITYTMITLAFFVGLSLFLENPFLRYWIPPDLAQNQTIPAFAFIPQGAVAPRYDVLAQSANGLNPLLRHFGMIIHPPMLYLGFVGFIIPYAFAMAALASGDLSSSWIKATRRWTLIAWLFLSLGLILGGRWAYDVLGWGGYWGWDPVENAAFIPWLVGTAFLHSVMIQEKRGMLKVWNMNLVIFTFSAVLFGTFATRSGLIDSVHAFAQSQIGVPMFLFWAAMTLVGVYMLLRRRAEGRLRDEHAFAGILSRETLFVLNNVVFVALAIAIFWGSFGAPIFAETVLGQDITLGREYFELVTPPLFVVMYILMGIAPLSAWGATSFRRLGRLTLVPVALTVATIAAVYLVGTRDGGALFGYGVVIFAAWVALYEIYRGAQARRRTASESLPAALLAIFGRNRRRYGGFIVHLGITVIGIGVIGSTLYQQETQQTMRPGETLDFGGYTMTYEGMQMGQIAEDGRILDIANITLVRNGGEVARLRPRHDFYPNAGEMNSINIAAAHGTLEHDYYVLLTGWTNGGETATFKVYLNPLINLVWWGGIILIVGTFISAWGAEKAPARARERATVDGRAAAGA